MESCRSRRSGLAAVLVGVALTLTGCAGVGALLDEDTDDPVVDLETAAPPATPGASEPTETADPRDRDPDAAQPGSALQMLYDLEVKGRAPKTGYDRDLFDWRRDVDRNGCDTRNDVLRRDLTDITLRDGRCVVLGGTLTSDYTGETFDFIRGDGNNIDIDHVVSLSNAWQTGAQQLSDSGRAAFANDPVNLLAVESGVNRSKGDGDAATWLPPLRSYRCEYVARQIQVKHDYDLWVTPPEFDAMERLLLDCDQDAFGTDDWPYTRGGNVKKDPTPRRTTAPEPKPAPDPVSRSGSSAGDSSRSRSNSGTSSSTSSGGTGSRGSDSGGIHYKNCDAARRAGAAPVYAGQPGYGGHLDRDGDGIGCE